MTHAAAVQNKMRSAADDVLGMMFLSPVIKSNEFPPAGWVDPIIVGLDFKGISHKGVCALAVEEGTACALAETFLCPEEGAAPVTRTAAREVMCELSNMLCGALLGQLNGQESFQLSTPRSLLPGEVGLMQPLHVSNFETKHGALLFAMALDADMPH